MNTITLHGLAGVSNKETTAKLIRSAEELEGALGEFVAATSADDNGAINVWKDDGGKICCCAMRHRATIEEKTYESLSGAKEWVKEWLEKIK